MQLADIGAVYLAYM